ncbi:MAG: hypothetical protein WBE37_29620 [Bryobacteraceae bacterium]
MPRTGSAIRNHSLLTAALEGLELQKQRIDEQIQEVRSLLGKTPGRRGRPRGSANAGSANAGSTNGGSTNGGSATKRSASRLSVAARKRIAAAQKRRWAEYRKSAGGKSE